MHVVRAFQYANHTGIKRNFAAGSKIRYIECYGKKLREGVAIQKKEVHESLRWRVEGSGKAERAGTRNYLVFDGITITTEEIARAPTASK